MEHNNIIWTIGHSTRPFEDFLAMLRSFSIEVIADVRHYPGSKRFPQFNKDFLEITLPQRDIQYIHFKELGGRRKAILNSKNIAWRNDAFRGYADYMETHAFKNAVHKLEAVGRNRRTAFMCSEAVWWRCHRSLVSDYLKANHWRVMHIMDVGKEQEYPYTSPARIVDGQLTYQQGSLF